jgi:allophanate hydrolase subunit 2
MIDWRKTVRDLSAEARLHFRARSSSNRVAVRLHTVAVYSSLALIAAIVFGAVSVRPF